MKLKKLLNLLRTIQKEEFVTLIMDNIALICGDGNLQYLIGNSLKNKKFNINFFILNSVKDKQKYKNEKHIHVNKLSVKTIISLLKSNIQKIILAGKKTSIYDVSFDLDTIKLAKKLILENKGDDNLLTTLKKYFEDNGFHFFNWTKHCKELFSNENNLTLSKPSKLALQNLDKAKTIYKYYKKPTLVNQL